MSNHQIATTIVALVEKVLGTGFDPITDDVLVDTLTSFLQETVTPVSSLRPVPDAHLEMAYEDRVSGWND
jgi:hypothetical protein